MSEAVAAGGAPARPAQLFDYLLRIADTSLVLAQRLGEWIGHAPAIEEDLGFANTALDLLGQARLLFAYAAEVEGRGRSEDDLAFLREEADYRNATLAELPNGDFGDTIVRQFLIDAYQIVLYGGLRKSRDARLAEIAAKALKETRYHLRYSSNWLVRLGDGTEESHARVQASLERFWPHTAEFFDADDLDRAVTGAGIAPPVQDLRADWLRQIEPVLAEATLQRPPDAAHRWYGKQGRHSEHLGHLLADLQYLQRAYPGARW